MGRLKHNARFRTLYYASRIIMTKLERLFYNCVGALENEYNCDGIKLVSECSRVSILIPPTNIIVDLYDNKIGIFNPEGEDIPYMEFNNVDIHMVGAMIFIYNKSKTKFKV